MGLEPKLDPEFNPQICTSVLACIQQCYSKPSSICVLCSRWSLYNQVMGLNIEMDCVCFVCLVQEDSQTSAHTISVAFTPSESIHLFSASVLSFCKCQVIFNIFGSYRPLYGFF